MSLLEHKSSCIAVVVLLVVSMMLLGIMNGLTAQRVSRYRGTKPVLILPGEKRRTIVLPAFQRIINISDGASLD